MAKAGADYSMGGVSSIEPTKCEKPEIDFPTGKGKVDLGGVISIDSSADLTYEAGDIFDKDLGKRPAIKLDADVIPDLPRHGSPTAHYDDETGHVDHYPPSYDHGLD